MRPWWPVLAGVGLITLAFAGDRIIGAAFDDATRTFTRFQVLPLEAAARLLVVALMVGLGWLVLRGERARLPGAAMLVVGGYVALVPALSFTLLTNTGISLPPLAMRVYEDPTGLTLWSGAAVMVLGLVGLIWPTPERDVVARETGTNAAPVSQQT